MKKQMIVGALLIVGSIAKADHVTLQSCEDSEGTIVAFDFKEQGRMTGTMKLVSDRAIGTLFCGFSPRPFGKPTNRIEVACSGQISDGAVIRAVTLRVHRGIAARRGGLVNIRPLGEKSENINSIIPLICN